jgi:hypothetical protein
LKKWPTSLKLGAPNDREVLKVSRQYEFTKNAEGELEIIESNRKMLLSTAKCK